jgi:hypothetical protein
MSAIRLQDLTKRPNAPLSARQLKQVEKWIKDDWESHDIDREAVVLIKRLLLTVKEKSQDYPLPTCGNG